MSETPAVTPAAQAHAEETGVDLNTVQGTGAGGTITKTDVAAAASSQPSTDQAVAGQTEPGAVGPGGEVAPAPEPLVTDPNHPDAPEPVVNPDVAGADTAVVEDNPTVSPSIVTRTLDDVPTSLSARIPAGLSVTFFAKPDTSEPLGSIGEGNVIEYVEIVEGESIGGKTEWVRLLSGSFVPMASIVPASRLS